MTIALTLTLPSRREFPEVFARRAPLNLRLVKPSCRQTSRSPSPRPSPLWRGRHVLPLSEQRGRADWRRSGERFSLSRGERAGVRGKEAFEFPKFARSTRGSWAGNGPSLRWEKSLSIGCSQALLTILLLLGGVGRNEAERFVYIGFLRFSVRQ